jgi:hypothetical protein
MNQKIKDAIEAAVLRLENKKPPTNNPVAIGDQFVLEMRTDIDISLLVINVHPDIAHTFLLVPMDSAPWVGLCDVICAEQLPLIARAQFSLWLPEQALPIANRVDYGYAKTAKACRHLLFELARGRFAKETPEIMRVENDTNYESHCFEVNALIAQLQVSV